MTFCVAGRDEASGLLGVAVTTARLAVGSRCLLVQPDVVIATQGLVSWDLACAVERARRDGLGLAEAVEAAARDDEGSDRRQLLALADRGAPAAFSGSRLPPVAGHRLHATWACGGNQLASAAVLDAVDEGFATGAHLPLPERLLAALASGQDSGGDRRGRQSAALRAVGPGTHWPGIDLRVDDDPDPVERLERLLALWRGEWGVYDATGEFPPARPARAADGTLRPPDPDQGLARR